MMWLLMAAVALANPVLVYNEDNSAFFFRTKYGNELGESALRGHVARIAAGGRVTHYFMCPNAMCASFDSKTRDPVWKGLDGEGAVVTNVSGSSSQACLEWMRGVKAVHDLGVDPYAVWTDECRRRGLSPWMTVRMNDIHNAEDPNNAQHSTFWRTHPEFRRGYPDGLSACAGNALDYAHKEVRDYNLAFVAELLERYDVDGVELDWLRFPFLLKEGRERADAHFLTAFVDEAKALTAQAAIRRGHPVALGVRVPTRIERARAIGLDVGEWVRKGLVDWIVPCNQWGSPDFNLPYEAWTTLAGPRVRVVPGLDVNITFGDEARRPLAYPEYAAFAARMYGRGARGIYLFNLFDQPRTNGVWNAIIDKGLPPDAVGALAAGVKVPDDFN